MRHRHDRLAGRIPAGLEVIYLKIIVQVFHIQAVRIPGIPGRYDVQPSAVCVDDVISRVIHLMDIRPVRRPQVHDRLVRHRRCPVKSVFAERSPQPCLVSLVIDIVDKVIRPCPHLFAVRLVILIRPDVEILALDHRIRSVQVLVDQVLDDLLVRLSRLVCRDIQIAGLQHLYARHIPEALCMIRGIDLRDHVDAVLLHVLLVLAVIILCIISVLSHDLRVHFALQAECAVS